MEYKEYTYYIEIEEKNIKPKFSMPKVSKSTVKDKFWLCALLPLWPLLGLMLVLDERMPF